MNYCVDCGKEINRKAIRCRSCSKRGDKNPSFGRGYFIKDYELPNETSFKKGHIPWNKGLTKKIDKRLKIVSEKVSGEKNGSWKGGTSKEPYSFDFNNKLKEQIKQRDNYICQNCNSKENLQVHHIDYNKKNSDLDNLIVLCSGCHSKTNFNRNYWINYFNEDRLNVN